jgi:beta-glucanase (GH16 family)
VYKSVNKPILFLSTLTVLLGVLSPSNALPVNSKLLTTSSISATWSGSKLVVGWKAPAGSKIRPTGYRVQIKSGKITKATSTNRSVRKVSFTGLAKKLNYEISIWSVTSKFQSLPIRTVFIGKQNKQTNEITAKKLNDMFVDSEPQLIQVSAPSKNVLTNVTTPNRCVIENNALKPIAVGECIVEFSAEATRSFVAAEPVSQSITIAPRTNGPQRVLLWEDSFNAAANTAPNNSYWTADISDGCQAPYSNCGWGNGERQWYLESQNRQDGSGSLTIRAQRYDNTSTQNCYYGKCEWRSGKITTYNKVSFTYGYMEASIKAPKGAGAWPAFWMLGTNIQTVPWPRCGELDIWEYKGAFPQLTYGTVHFANSGGGHTYLGGIKDTLKDLSESYNRYGMLWLEDEITFYINDELVYRVAKSQSGLAHWPFGKNAQGQDPKFYAILNLAMGGHFGGAIDSRISSSEVKVDWVKYYSVDGVGKVTIE